MLEGKGCTLKADVMFGWWKDKGVFLQVFTWFGATVEVRGQPEVSYVADEVSLGVDTLTQACDSADQMKTLSKVTQSSCMIVGSV